MAHDPYLPQNPGPGGLGALPSLCRMLVQKGFYAPLFPQYAFLQQEKVK